jgi:hypothetical protein
MGGVKLGGGEAKSENGGKGREFAGLTLGRGIEGELDAGRKTLKKKRGSVLIGE